MTARPLDHLWSPTSAIRTHFDAKPLALVDETVALRRCALFRDGFKGMAVGYPARLLRFDAVAAWIRRRGVTVDVTSADELVRAMAVGIDAEHIVMHAGDGAAAIRRAVNAGVARFVVSSSKQVEMLADSADRTQCVVVDASDRACGAPASDVLTHPELDLIGLHCNLEDSGDGIGPVQVRHVVAEMTRIRREYGVLLTRISLAGLDVDARDVEPRFLRRVGEALGEVVGDACTQYRYPRPALTLSPRASALLPAA